MEKKNILVSGGAGFIGSFLCEALLKEGNRVICVDNFSTGHVRNIDTLLRHPEFQFLKIDICEPFQLESFAELDAFKVKFVGIHEIYHLATPTSLSKSAAFRIPALLAHSVGTRNMLDLAVKYRAKFLLTSSATVYGARQSDVAIAEDVSGCFDHLQGRNAFHEGKRFAETLAAAYADMQGIDTKIARIFRTYGPRMALFQGHQIPDLVLHALDGKELVFGGEEKTPTTLAYVTDVVDGMLRLMKAEKGIGPVNIGSDEERTLGEIAKLILQLTEQDVAVQYEPPSPDLMQVSIPLLTKARDHLGWLPLVRLEDGLRKTIDDIRANRLLLTNEG